MAGNKARAKVLERIDRGPEQDDEIVGSEKKAWLSHEMNIEGKTRVESEE